MIRIIVIITIRLKVYNILSKNDIFNSHAWLFSQFFLSLQMIFFLLFSSEGSTVANSFIILL